MKYLQCQAIKIVTSAGLAYRLAGALSIHPGCGKLKLKLGGKQILLVILPVVSLIVLFIVFTLYRSQPLYPYAKFLSKEGKEIPPKEQQIFSAKQHSLTFILALDGNPPQKDSKKTVLKLPKAYAENKSNTNTFKDGSTTINANISHLKKQDSEIPLNIEKTNDNSYAITVSSKNPESIMPGRYTLSTVIESAGRKRELTQDFYWGVLAFNTNKSVYLENGQAKIDFAVLDPRGSTLCDADLELDIKIPEENIETVSTYNTLIQKSGKCDKNNVTDVPDYSAFYKLGKAGMYEITLTAKTGYGDYKIKDFIKVEKSVPFDVERTGPTRINYLAPYDMKIRIKANQDFTGEIVETVPNSFKIQNPTLRLHSGRESEILNKSQIQNSNVQNEIRNLKLEIVEKDEVKKLIWNGVLKKGETAELEYTFDGPDISPEFFLLGPLQFKSEILNPKSETNSNIQNSNNQNVSDFVLSASDLLFSEARQWQIASDANPKIRQEINIIDTIVTATGDDPAQIKIDGSKYNGETAYLEVVAKVNSGTLTVGLQAVGSASNTDSVNVTATSYTRVRSGTGFTPGSDTYQINLSGGTTPMVKAARVIILQDATTITDTETQIEIGNYEAGKNNTSLNALNYPKYWKYTEANWDGTKTFTASVTYKVSGSYTGTQTFSSSTSWTPRGITSVAAECWGGGAGGSHNGSSAARPGGGGGGGAYAKTNSVAVTPGNSYTVTVGAAVSAETNGNNSSFVGDSSQSCVGAGGTTTTTRSGGAGGTTAASTGDLEYAGGAGGTAANSNNNGGAGGGEGAGTTVDGNGGSANSGATGGAGGTGGDGGDGGRGGDNSDSPVASTNGTAPGGGGGGSGGNVNTGKGGAAGQVKLSWTSGAEFVLQEDDNLAFSSPTNTTIVAAGQSTSATRVVSGSFSPSNEMYYRIASAESNSDTGMTYDIYDAKIIVTQTNNPTKLEPQYLIANTGSFGGSTGLKDFDTYFADVDVSGTYGVEWSIVTNSYYHEGNGVSSGTGDMDLRSDPNGTSTLVTNSGITDTVEVERTGAMTMPASAQDIDVNVTGTGTLNASRIIVQTVIPPPALSQNHFWWRDDSTALNTSGGWLTDAEDQTGTEFASGTVYRLRVEIANTGSGPANSYQYRLEYAARTGETCGDETFAAVPVTATSEPFEMVLSDQYADGNNTTSGFLTATGTRSNGKAVEDPSNQTAGLDLTNSYYTEFEYAISPTTNATGGQTYCFRLTNAGSATYFSYSTYAQATMTLGNQTSLYLKFDDARGTAAQDSTSNNNDGAFSGSPTWQTEDLCISGKCLYFPGGTSGSVTVSNTVTNVKSISFWVRSATSSAALVDLDGSKRITAASGTISATNFTSPTYYINGKSTTSPTLTANSWNHIVVTTGTAINASSIKIGNFQGDFLKGFMDEVKLYNYALSTNQVKAELNARGAIKGVSARMGGAEQKWLSDGLVGYWKMDESSGNAADSSGNGTTLTNVSATAFATGKFGNGADPDGVADYFQAADNATLSLTGDLTISVWINPDTVAAGSYDIAGKWDYISGAAHESYLLQQSGDEIVFYIDSASSYITTNAANLLAAGGWYHVLATYKASNQTAAIYVNGVSQAVTTTGTIPASIGDDTDRFHVGAEDSSTSATNFYNGQNDEARIYNRALSPTEVRQLADWAPGPVGYWNFEEGQGNTVKDSSGNSTTLSFSGDPKWGTGKVGKALILDGDTDDVDVTDPGTTLEPLSGSISIEAWVRLDPTYVDNFPTVVQHGGSSDTNVGYWFFWHNSNNFLNFTISDGTDRPNVNSTTGVIKDNLWHHVAGVFDTTNNIAYIYIDGKLNASSTTNWNLVDSVDSSDTFTIGGGDGDSDGGDWKGGIDDFRVYKYNRSAKQIVEDMNAGHPAGGSPVGSQVGYWKFDEGYNSTANDSTPNNNDLTLSTTSWTLDGKFGKAFMGGSNKRLTTPSDDADFDFGATEELTLSVWFKRNTISAAEYLVSKIASNVGYGLYMDSDGDVVFGISDAGSASFPEESIGGTLSKNYDDNLWHHAVAVKSGTSSIKLYVDGKQIASDTSLSESGSLENAAQLIVGDANTGDGTDEFLGVIDELKIYRYAMTEDEVRLDYNQGKSLVLGSLSDTSGLTGGSVASNSASAAYCIPGDTTSCAKPFAHYKMDENTGTTTLYDSSGNNYNGTLANMTSSNWVSGKIGSALSFNGSNNNVDIYSSGFDSDFSETQGTLTAWIRIPDSATWTDSVGHNAVTLRGPDSSHAINIRKASNNQLGIKYQWAASSCGDDFTSTSYNGNTGWIHTALVWNTSTQDTWTYVNGKLANFASNVLTACDSNALSSTNTVIGAQDTSSTIPWIGLVDDVRVYNYTRTPAQIAWDYNRGKPVNHFKLDECTGTAVKDSAGSGVTGTLNLQAAPQTTAGTCTTSATTAWYNGRTGKFNYSLNFDGDDYISTGSFSPLATAAKNTTKFSWGGWFYPTTSAASKTLLFKTTEFKLTTDASSKPICNIYTGGAFTTNTAGAGSTALTLDSWNHLLCVYDGANIYAYLNGKQVDSWIQTGNTAAASSAFYIGSSSTPNQYFTGQIDDVRIYNYNLTSTQTKLIMNEASAVRFGPSTGSP